jgi:hypothetical protein
MPPFKPPISPRPDTWWTRAMSRAAFMATAASEQPRMSAECDPRLILNLQRDGQSSFVGRTPKLERFLPDYSEQAEEVAA